MKTMLFSIFTLVASLICTEVFAQEKVGLDSLGLPGDNLNLYAVLDLFQKSETLEGFEQSLNNADSKVNNLDLNGDNKIDYIRVIDNVKGTAHAIVLQVAVNQKENQDVAVIEVEKSDDGKVQIQVVGDEQLYGKNYIVEPKQASKKMASAGTPNPGYTGTTTTNITNNYNNNNYNSNNSYNNGGGYNSYNNGGGYNYWYPVSSWSIVHYMYYPSYVTYVSPWSWGYYPNYWNPWTPLFWHSYYYGWIYPRCNHYYGWYYRSYECRNMVANGYYGHRRSTSATVNQKRVAGDYNKTYSRPDLAYKQTPAGRTIATENKLVESKANKGAAQMSTTNMSPSQSGNKPTSTNTISVAKQNNAMGQANENHQLQSEQQMNQSNTPHYNNGGNQHNSNAPAYTAPQHSQAPAQYSAPQQHSAPSNTQAPQHSGQNFGSAPSGGGMHHGGGGRGR
jgi:hypothetical protein